MLPFLKKKQQVGVIVHDRTPDEMLEQADKSDLEIVAEELIHAVSMKDAKAVSEALKAAFDICDAGYDQDEDTGYDEQNEIAGREDR